METPVEPATAGAGAGEPPDGRIDGTSASYLRLAKTIAKQKFGMSEADAVEIANEVLFRYLSSPVEPETATELIVALTCNVSREFLRTQTATTHETEETSKHLFSVLTVCRRKLSDTAGIILQLLTGKSGNRR
jgi:DNA-binding phage protein